MFDKVILFKVEITQTTIDNKWQSYIVKRMSDDNDLVAQFRTLHSLKVVYFIVYNSI